ncbi:MAG: hypothetical protein AAF790_09810, partial [Planctomycetota bacterium]
PASAPKAAPPATLPSAPQANAQTPSADDLLRRGVDLLGQQIWCWGQDVARAEGNWLVEVGFRRTQAPADQEKCISLYTLELPEGRRVVLRGFGVFYGCDGLGGVFLPRYEFRPRYLPRASLPRPPWTDADLPKLGPPADSQREACAALTAGVLDWIASYEEDVARRLGVAYREATLQRWNNGRRRTLPATDMPPAWRSLAQAVAGGGLLP